jgi:hypothetical protein
MDYRQIIDWKGLISDGEIERRLPKIAREIKKVIICPFGKNTE